MLFLGTEKYPDENSYSAFLSSSGGSSNAATYPGIFEELVRERFYLMLSPFCFPDLTKFYFDVVPAKFSEALDRFSQFFIAPLFTEGATMREINAGKYE